MAGYLGNIPTPQATQTRDTFTATSGQTSFATSGYTVGMLDVYLNGIKLASADFTATNGSDVVLASGASTDDIVEVVSYSTFDSASGAFSVGLKSNSLSNFSGDQDSGIDLSTNDVVAVKIAGSEKARIHSDGSLGLGTANPTRQLTVENTIANSGGVIGLTSSDSSTSGTCGIIHFGNSTDSSLASINGIAAGATDAGAIVFKTEATGGAIEQRMKINSDGRTQIDANKATGFACEIVNDGDNSNRYGLHLQCGADNASGTNYAITFYDGDVTSQGNITFSSGTVTYGAFTAHHEISLPDADKSSGYLYGTLLEVTNIYYTQKDGSDTERGIRYVTQKSSSQYSKKILGTYCGDLLAVADSSGTYKNNLHQAAVLGDGHILCNNSGGNIKVGDGICASATLGIGQKADKLCMIMGIAQKDITFSGSETVLVPVQYGLQQFTPWTD